MKKIDLRQTISMIWLLAAAAAHTQPVGSEHVKIYAAAAVKTSLTALVAEYERTSDSRFTVVFDSAGAAQQKFLADPDGTLLITTPARIQQAESQGALPGGITTPLGTSVAGVAVPPGSAKPDISSPEKFRAALLEADAIAFSDPSRGATVGNHFMMVIESLGIKDEVLQKATLARNGIETMRLVIEEGVGIGITQTVEILQANREALAGPFPEEFELVTTYSLWHRANISSAVRDFVSILTGPAGREKRIEEGLLPPVAR
jgi:molybdate transport system substrate-binding protein